MVRDRAETGGYTRHGDRATWAGELLTRWISHGPSKLSGSMYRPSRRAPQSR